MTDNMSTSFNDGFEWDEENVSTDNFPAPDYAPDRWATISRNYSYSDVEKLRGSIEVKHTLAELGAKKLWDRINNTPYVNTLGAFTGCQAVQQTTQGRSFSLLSPQLLIPCRQHFLLIIGIIFNKRFIWIMFNLLDSKKAF